MSKQELGRVESSPVRQAEERKILPSDNVAVIGGKSPEGAVGDFRFTAEIGHVQRYPDYSALLSDMQNRNVTYGFEVPRGEHAGWVGVKPVEPGKSIDISVPAFQDRATGTAKLALYSIRDQDNPERVANVDVSVFTEQGFDLNQENASNKGVTLSPELSQLLYDFQTGQGQFAAEEKK